MKNKRAQVTLFIILAILIVGGIAGIFMFRDRIFSEQQYPSDIIEIKNFVEDCLETTAKNSLFRIGERGGYFLIFDEPSIEGRIPYYLQETKKSVLTKQEVELNLAGFVQEELSFCILNFKDFRKDFIIEHSLNKVEAKILQDKTRFSLEYPITINKRGTETAYQLKDFSVDIPVNLDKIYSVAQKIIEEQAKNPDSICLSCLFDLGREYNVHIDMLDYGNSTIFTIIDDNSQINERSYEWNFAID
jgi:hypothetical protein